MPSNSLRFFKMEVPAWFLKTIFLFTICGVTGSWSAPATDFSPKDFVRITSSEDLIAELHSHGIGYLESMAKTLGKIGSIDYIDTEGDLHVVICDARWTYSPKAVTKLASADGDSSPEVSSDCRPSKTNVTVWERRLGDYVNLECKVDDHFYSLPISVRWVKGGEIIYIHPRFTASSNDTNIYTLKITDVQPEDSGWYTCDVMHGGGLIDTNAMEFNVNQYTNFEEGDLVQITSNEDWLSKVHRHRVGYNHLMERSLGKIGRVKDVTPDGDINVAICDTTWYYSTKVLTKLTSAGTNTPFVSSYCARSPAKMTVKQKKVDGSVILECSVVDQPDNSIIKWMKGSEQYSLNVDRSTNSSGFKIRNATSKDEGWYTCELRDKDDDLAATATLEVIVFEVGDLVQITSDEDLISELHRGGIIGYNAEMKKTLGKIGVVWRVDINDVLVHICKHFFYYNSKVITKLASAGNSTPSVSSTCVISSAAMITVKQNTVGNSAQLECSVTNQPDGFKLRWLKGSDEFARDSSNIASNNRFTIAPNLTPSNFNLNVNDVKPEDAGWYTCELNVPDGVVATGAVLLEVQQQSSTA